MNARQIRRVSGGVTAIAGGVLFGVATVNEAFIGLDRTQSMILAAAVGLLLAGGEVALVSELAGVYPAVALAISAFLALAAALIAIGLYSLMFFGAIVGVAYAGVGLIPWILAAPLAALLIARKGILARPPAVALGVMTLTVFAASASRVDGLVLISFVAYGLAWAWIGLVLLNAAFRSQV